MPDLKRLNYFHGQMLGVNDFRTEQSYFRDKHKLHNRCLHGYGTVCGLMVARVSPPDDCESPSDAERAKLQAELEELRRKLAEAHERGDKAGEQSLSGKAEAVQRALDELPADDCAPQPTPRVALECGFALDCDGNEIVVQRSRVIDPWHLLSVDDRKLVESNPDGVDLYLSICYCEQAIDSARPILPDACGNSSECNHGKVRESYNLRITTEAPPRDKSCDPCCQCCEDHCLLLAVLRGFRKGVGATAVDNSVRRVMETKAYPATTITGISWTHDATYSSNEAGDIIGSPNGTAGLQINFSRPVLTSTLTRGVLDMWIIEGGRTKHAGVYYLEGEFEDFGGADTVASCRYRYLGDENLDPGDRVMITMRCAFVLDECCQPVDGTHVGGRVPLIDDPEFEKFERARPYAKCAVKPPGYGPWTSGAGTPGVTFESWFFIENADRNEKRRAPERVR
jgi:hypothetical protein